MPEPDGTEREQLGRHLVELVQRLSTAAGRVGQAFAASQGLHQTDLEALLHVMHAEAHGRPLTAGALGRALGLTTGATTGVIDRLEGDGHIDRRRDSADRRRVHLHQGAAGQAVAREFFGPLGDLSDDIMATFTVEELGTVARFLAGMTTAMECHAPGPAADRPSRKATT